jgi:hypothetical protein
MKCPECDLELSSATYGKFKCPECLTEIISSMNGGMRVIEKVKKPLSKMAPVKRIKSSLKPLKKICIGCWKEINQAFVNHGTLIKSQKGGFIKTTEEWSYDPVKDKIEKTLKETFIPLPAKQRGFICDDCITTKVITRLKRIGKSDLFETIYIPICKLDPLPTATETLPGAFIHTPRIADKIVKEDRPYAIKWEPPLIKDRPKSGKKRKRKHQRRAHVSPS